MSTKTNAPVEQALAFLKETRALYVHVLSEALERLMNQIENDYTFFSVSNVGETVGNATQALVWLDYVIENAESANASERSITVAAATAPISPSTRDMLLPRLLEKMHR